MEIDAFISLLDSLGQSDNFIRQLAEKQYQTILDDAYNTLSPTSSSTSLFLLSSLLKVLSDSSISIATYINISNTLNNQYVSGNLFNSNTPYISYIPALTSGGSFPTRTTFTYKDTYNTDINSSNVLSNGSYYSINMYVCICEW